MKPALLQNYKKFKLNYIKKIKKLRYVKVMETLN